MPSVIGKQRQAMQGGRSREHSARQGGAGVCQSRAAEAPDQCVIGSRVVTRNICTASSPHRAAEPVDCCGGHLSLFLLSACPEGMADDREPHTGEEEEPEAGPLPPPPGAEDAEEEEADVGPVLPKAKKRKVGDRRVGGVAEAVAPPPPAPPACLQCCCLLLWSRNVCMQQCMHAQLLGRPTGVAAALPHVQPLPNEPCLRMLVAERQQYPSACIRTAAAPTDMHSFVLASPAAPPPPRRCWSMSSSTWGRCRCQTCTKSLTCTETQVGAGILVSPLFCRACACACAVLCCMHVRKLYMHRDTGGCCFS